MLRDSCIHRGQEYRHGGDEFLLLLPNQAVEEVEGFAERLRRRVKTYEFVARGEPERTTVSIGDRHHEDPRRGAQHPALKTKPLRVFDAAHG